MCRIIVRPEIFRLLTTLSKKSGAFSGMKMCRKQHRLLSLPLRRALHSRGFEFRIRDLLCGMGFSETYNYSFFDAEKAEQLGYAGDDLIELENPLDANERHMRSSLVPGMLNHFALNARRKSGVQLFELGRSYEKTANAAHEKLEHRLKFKNQAAFERRLLCLSYSSGEDEKALGSLLSPPVAGRRGFLCAHNGASANCQSSRSKRAYSSTDSSYIGRRSHSFSETKPRYRF